MAEAGRLQSLYDSYGKQGFLVITALNGSGSDDVTSWVEEYGLTHPVLADESMQLFNRYNPDAAGWPDVTMFKRGLVVESIGSISVEDAAIEELLAE